MQHITVYRDPNRYAGWPANYGIWSWGDEIVAGFTVGYPNPQGGFHARDRTWPFVAMQARMKISGAGLAETDFENAPITEGMDHALEIYTSRKHAVLSPKCIMEFGL